MTANWVHTKSALSSLESKLKCLVCEKLPVNPQLLWCKHSFCQECISSEQACPRCKFPISPQETVPDIMLNKLIQAMKVAAQISKCDKEHSFDEKETMTASKRKLRKDIQTVDTNIKNVNVKDSDTLKSTNKEVCDDKDMIQEQSGCKKTNELKMSSLRKSRRGSSGRNSMEREKQELSDANELKMKALRRSSRGSSGRNSMEREKQELSDANELIIRSSRRSSRGKSMEREKQELSAKKNVKEAKSQNMSPKPVMKKNDNVMSTPKTNAKPKSGTPILFSAKKVQQTNKVNSKGETPLQIACRQGKLNLVQQLLGEGVEPNVKDYANWTPLCDAVGSGNIEVVRTLLDVGAAVNTPSNLNTTALVEAVVKKNKAMVELLMSHGADMHQRTALNNTALSLADDDMRALMMSYSNVRIQPPPKVPVTPRAILVDKIPQDHVEKVMDLCKMFNLTLSTVFMEDITHVIVEKSAANTCEASTAVMLAIVSGSSVVGVDWVTTSLEAGRLAAVDEFEPRGTHDYPDSNVFCRARLNKEQLLPRLFDGCHISLQQDQPWPPQLKQDIVTLISTAGAVYQPRQCDPERIPPSEATVMYHTSLEGPFGTLSHIILYQAGPKDHQPLLKYNMAHAKSLPLSWFLQCIKTFSVTMSSAE